MIASIDKEVNIKPRFISLCSDTTFKYLYKNIKTRSWLNNIIKELFGLDLEGYQLIDNEFNTGNKTKDYRLDLILEKDNNIVIIEMNNNYYKFLTNKNYQYLYRVAGTRFEQGEDYSDKPSKLILFNNYVNRKEPNRKKSNYKLNELETGLIIPDIESYEIYLPNFKRVCYDTSKVEVSLSLFSCKSYEEMREKTTSKEDIKIIEELERLAMNEKFIYDYDREAVRIKTENSIRKEAMELGERRGMHLGERKEKRNIVKAMLKDNVAVNLIAKYTGLSTQEINKLAH